MTVRVKRGGVWIDADGYQVGDELEFAGGTTAEIVGISDGRDGVVVDARVALMRPADRVTFHFVPQDTLPDGVRHFMACQVDDCIGSLPGSRGDPHFLVEGWAILCAACCRRHNEGEELSVWDARCIGGDPEMPTISAQIRPLAGRVRQYKIGDKIGVKG